MSYIGRQPLVGSYSKVDDVSASFNGSTTTFPINVGGVATVVGNAQAILISVNGVIQEPISSYSISGTNIVFTEAPTAGMGFFAIILGNTLNIGVPSDGTVSNAKLVAGAAVANIGYQPAKQVAFVDKGTQTSGTHTFTVSAGGHQRIQVGGAITLATAGWAVSGIHDELLIELVNGASASVTWPAINWVKDDGTFTTTFASNGVTLQSAGTDWVLLWTRDGGTTVYGKIAR